MMDVFPLCLAQHLSVKFKKNVLFFTADVVAVAATVDLSESGRFMKKSICLNLHVFRFCFDFLAEEKNTFSVSLLSLLHCANIRGWCINSRINVFWIHKNLNCM